MTHLVITKAELKPCPFCGGEAEIFGDTTTLIRCSNDQCISLNKPFNNYGHRHDAISAWNTRQASTDYLVEALRPFAALELPAKAEGNAGFYSIRHRDILAARSAISKGNVE